MKRVVFKPLYIFLIAGLLFFLRLAYGLTSEFWFEDELQVYLIGLKFYTTGKFPFFGPDIVYTGSQIPGALLGLLVGLPFYVLRIPEAPYIFLNLLSFASLCFFALYLQKRFPGIPSWFLWIWLLTCPWTLNLSTHVINPSYVLFGAVLFFVSFMESDPKQKIGFIKLPVAFFMMGFALFWVYQLHMSWVLLLPFIIYAIYLNRNERKIFLVIFLLGCLSSAATLIPTFWQYGIFSGSGGVSSNVVFNASNGLQFINFLMRYLSLAANEIPRFIDTDGAPKIEFFSKYFFVAPLILFVIILGFLQVAYMIIAFFLRNPDKTFIHFRKIFFAAFLITYISFFFSVKGPSTHTFYVLFPLVFVYSMYCWQPLFRRKWFAVMMAVMLFCGIVTTVTLSYHNYHLKSLYKNRELPLKAIQEKSYHVLGERRPTDRNP